MAIPALPNRKAGRVETLREAARLKRESMQPDLRRERWIPPDKYGRPQDPTSWATPGDGFWGRFFINMWDAWGDPYWWPGANAWECASGAILVQNTTWNSASKTILSLCEAGYNDAESLLAAPVETVEQTIRSVGYYRAKTRKLRELAAWWIANSADTGGVDDISDDDLRAQLLNIWGIGPETADDILVYCFGRPWFVVDAYAIRLRQRLTGSDLKLSYDQLQQEVHAELPRDYMLLHQLHGLVDKLCGYVCQKKPSCEVCPILELCEYGKGRQ
ncbi:MAG TPA: endonuclease [Bacteroidetes bacterium]|nr:endonuclease [Bacteroidota bacterium]HEX04025.1 endonuclease [Bacteroidota bacterium]